MVKKKNIYAKALRLFKAKIIPDKRKKHANCRRNEAVKARREYDDGLDSGRACDRSNRKELVCDDEESDD